MPKESATYEGATTAAPMGSIMDRRVDSTNSTGLLEDSPCYEVLNQHNLLTKKYRIETTDELELVPPNSSPLQNMLTSWMCCPLVCMGCIHHLEVHNAQLKMAFDGRGNFVFFGPGNHQVRDVWYRFLPGTHNFATENISFGDRNIVTIGQGFVGYCTDRGEPVLLPPGMHQWRSPTLHFERAIDLNEAVIFLGPYTLLTIDQGYMAVTQDNGKQIILEGGAVYLLTHRNWKFENFVSTKIQTHELKRNEAASADNVIMLVDATVLWRISDVQTAVRMSAETMSEDGSKKSSGDILKLRNDVLRQAEASLAFFIGTINFSDTMAAAAMDQRSRGKQQGPSANSNMPLALASATPNPMLPASNSAENVPMTDAEIELFNLYDNEKLRDAVAHANEITETYGVEIISINIISAIPKDKELQASLAKGAVAAAEAQMLEITAEGNAQAMQIGAKAQAKQTLILAQADADADVMRAEGAKQAADLISQNSVSIELAKIDRTGRALDGKSSLFFGADSRHMSSLLANSNVVSHDSGV